MTKRQFTFTITLIFCSALSMAAQQSRPRTNQAERVPCERYKMRIAKPDSTATLAKTPEVQPDARFDYKGVVIDPCAQADTQAVKAPPRTSSTPKPIPLFKLNPEPDNKLLSPAEMLKKLNQPAPPKSKP